jgi:ATPase family associated with various cellular activities (AAA)
MAAPDLQAAAKVLGQELDWLVQVIGWRFQRYFGTAQGTAAPVAARMPPPPRLPRPTPAGSAWAALLQQQQATPAERLALALALAPHLRPQALDVFFTRNHTFDKPFAEFGAAVGTAAASAADGASGVFQPSGQTLAFLLAGDDLAARLALLPLFQPAHWLARQDLLRLGPTDPGTPLLRGALQLQPAALTLLGAGGDAAPSLGAAFPARPVHTTLGWDDLVLHPGTAAQLDEIQSWVRHGHTLLHDWGMAGKLRPGLRALFHGPPGTGKTLTAALLGQAAGRAVWQIDLSLVVSKYIGETEKNLSRVFDVAEQRGWLLFFDEADALFGKRSDTRDAHDRYANQEVAWLLQRVESFSGIAILASNQKDNLDPAFTRRFEAVVHFPLPRADERQLDDAVSLPQIAARHALAGAEIVNCVRAACLLALDAGGSLITEAMLQRAIRRELAKDGREH